MRYRIYISYETQLTSNCVDIICFGHKGVLTVLKHVYKVKRNSYL